MQAVLVDAPYRGKGIGKKLIFAAIALSGQITNCIVYPLAYANADTLAFYRAIGFADLGPDTRNKTNIYGINCTDMYLSYRLDIERSKSKKIR